jgi:hypothetical protein
MSDYAWIITKDLITNQGEADPLPTREGWVGPRDAPDALISKLQLGKGLKFRMRDDDGILYYCGRFIDELGNDADNLDENAFGPLDDLGTPDAGAVSIEYLNPATKKWERL